MELSVFGSELSRQQTLKRAGFTIIADWFKAPVISASFK